MELELNYLLSAEGIDTKNVGVLVMRHTRNKQILVRRLLWLAAEDLDLFNNLQTNHYPKAEKQLKRADYLISCIGHRPRQALFIGLYKVNGHRPISKPEYWEIPRKPELQRLGLIGARDFTSIELFDLELTPKYQEWKGKLILDWPPPALAWTRWANQKTEFPVKAILEESALDKEMPSWKELILTWQELHALPKLWINTLSQWRGIYFILDTANGKGYVGSAGGKYNLYGRWKNYADTGHGGNKRLLKRDPDKFLFSILERVSPDAEQTAVTILENNWQDRLHTREFGLNGD
jgi:hypothetical protein